VALKNINVKIVGVFGQIKESRHHNIFEGKYSKNG